MHALSNYPIWYRTIENRLELSRFLKWTFVSCLTGFRKPELAAFLGAAQILNRPVETCLLIDDSMANCEAAERAGMPAIHFIDAGQLWQELQRRGLVG